MKQPHIEEFRDYKGILLDLDNTLYRYSPCHDHALKKCHEFFNNHVEKISFLDFSDLYEKGRKAVKKYNYGTSGSRSRHLYFQRALEIRYGKTQIYDSLTLGDLYWKSFIERMKLKPWVINLLETVKRSGTKIALITNQEASLQFKKIKHLGIGNLIDYIVTSEEAGVEKPARRIIEIALNKIKLKPSDIVFLGDDKKEDGLAARSVGIKFILCD